MERVCDLFRGFGVVGGHACLLSEVRKIVPAFIIIIILGTSDQAMGQITMTPLLTLGSGGGILRGSIRYSRGGKSFFSFEGIRYGTANRFEVARPTLDSWEGIKDATEVGAECVHMMPSAAGSLMGTRGKEDCLFLNVYTPNTNKNDGPHPKKLLPVMFWIHGGAFVIGAGAWFQPTYFMDEEVVYVSINYRLGALGLLYTEDDAVPGNLALRDMILALKWVQRNIKFFGGDPSRVTIFGTSSGGICVSHLLLSSMAKDLFHGAIVMSGSLGATSISHYPRWHAERFGAELGCRVVGGNTSAMIECLKKVDVDTFAEAQSEEDWGPLPSYQWAPVVEQVNSNNQNGDYVITEHPADSLAYKHFASKVPLMIGQVLNEGAFPCSSAILNEPELTQEINTNWTSIAPFVLLYYKKREYGSRIDAISKKIREYYFGDLDIDLATEQRLTDLFSDRWFTYGTENMALSLASVGSPVYPYMLTFYDGYSFVEAMMDYHHFVPPSHGDDIQYFFPTMVRQGLDTEAELQFSRRVVKMWASFAATGKPEATWGSAATWPAVPPNATALTWYKLDRNTQLLPDPFRHRKLFWDNLLQNELKGYY